VLVTLLAIPLAVVAQVQDGRWSDPFRLSTSEGSVSESVVFSDQYGYVHVFWIENGYQDGRTRIYYSRFDGITWATPIDIYNPREFGFVDHLSAVVDQTGTIHLVWTEGGVFRGRPVSYMKAPADGALSAKNWSKPQSIGPWAHLVRLLVDSENNLHLIFSKYNEPNPGLYYTRSEDRGETWSSPFWLDPDIPTGHSPDKLKVSIDDLDGLHVVWYYTPTDLSSGNWIRYTHSLDGGLTWKTPVTIERDEANTGNLSSSDPLIINQGEHVHIIWGSTNPNFARSHRISMDRGQNWGPAVPVFANLEGQAFDGLAVDSANRVHYFGQIRFPQGIHHAMFQDYQWSLPALIYLIRRNAGQPFGDYIHAHHLRPVVLGGNLLVLTLHDPPSDETRQLYVMTRVLTDAPLEEFVSLPTPTPVPLSTQTPESPVETPTPIPLFQDSTDPAEINSRSVGIPIWIGAGLALFFVGVVFFIRFLKWSR
jgi:hypothetical protein